MLIALVVTLLALALHRRTDASRRESFVLALTVAGVLSVVFTVGPSLLHTLSSEVATTAWGVTLLGALLLVRRSGSRSDSDPATEPEADRGAGILRGARWLELAVVAVLLLLTLTVALRSVPRVYDALAYHLPRVLFWIENQSAGFFPTPEPRQNYISPFTSYATVQAMLVGFPVLRVFDSAQQLVQWTAYLGVIVAATLIADQLGARRSTLTLVAALVATLPNLALQAQTALSDVVATFWFAVSVWAMLRARRVASTSQAALSGALVGSALGLSMLTKASLAFALLPFGLWWILRSTSDDLRRRDLRRRALEIAVAGAVLLSLNAYHLTQAQLAYGNPLSTAGHTSYLNESLTPPAMAGSFLEHLGSQLTLPVTTAPVRIELGDGWNRGIERVVRALEGWIGVDPDADNLPEGTRYSLALDGPTPPPVANSPQSGASPLHFVLGGVAVAFLLARSSAPRARRALAAAAVVGFVLMACAFRWQPWIVRFHLPTLVLAAVLAALAWEEWEELPKRARPTLRIAVVLGLFASTTTLVALHQEHDLRTVWTTPKRDLQVQATLVRPLAERLAHLESVGILAPPNVIEYPFLAALLESSPDVHVAPVFAELPWRGGLRRSHDTPDGILLVTQYRAPRPAVLERLRREHYREVLANPMGRAFVRRRTAPPGAE